MNMKQPFLVLQFLLLCLFFSCSNSSETFSQNESSFINSIPNPVVGDNGGTSGGNPQIAQVNANFGAFDNTDTAFHKAFDFLIPKAHSSIQYASLCVDSLTFTAAGGAEIVFNNVGERLLDPNGTFLHDMAVPKQVYTQLKIKLNNICASNNFKAIDFTNNFGSFSETRSIMLLFVGSYNANDGKLVLDIPHIIKILNDYNGNGASINQLIYSTIGVLQ